MFWQLSNGNNYEYHAVTSIKTNIARATNALYGQHHVIITLSNGKTVEHTFEADDWRKFAGSYRKEGFVLNA